jgi:acetamidase/formamidase
LGAADLSGEWYLSVTAQGERVAANRVQITQTGDTFTFKFQSDEFKGTLSGSKVDLDAGRVKLTGVLVSDSRMEGDGRIPSGLPAKWVAERIVARSGQPKTHEFTPTKFERYFSSATPPVLRINPGDTVKTWSVDAGGRAPDGKVLSLGGNPLTGPFYIEGARPGDTLVVKLNRVRLNRDTAISGRMLLANAVGPFYVRDMKDDQKYDSSWALDRTGNTAALAKPSAGLRNFRVPMKPMLGCVAVAPPGQDVVSTRDSGQFGGNMDYNQIVEGTTVYLPVFHPGALLLVGDGHAAQGDGELTGDALETSMDIEFTVDVKPGNGLGIPMAENDEYLMMIGIGGSLDQALQRSTTAMARMLEREYKLTSNEAAILMGFALKYDIADLVGTQVSIVAKMPKLTLAQLGER